VAHSGDATARFPSQEQAADDCLYFFLGLLSFAEHYDQALEGIQVGNPHALAGTALPTLSVAAQFTAHAESQPHLFIRDLLR
jgi:hypothetical protein